MFKKIAVTATALALTTGAILTTQTDTAEAGNEWGAAAGGFVAGAIVGSVLTQPRYYAPAPRRVYRPAPVVTYRLQPWTPAWYQYCSRKYRSFNPNTGYFLAYSGQYRFCR